jgi:hypothetical protein
MMMISMAWVERPREASKVLVRSKPPLLPRENGSASLLVRFDGVQPTGNDIKTYLEGILHLMKV